jgi:hypothetical protein
LLEEEVELVDLFLHQRGVGGDLDVVGLSVDTVGGEVR